ncbi:MAG TPA: Tm-1-like ATP-binding domain-containing protein [Bryobacteraceae bacterium]|nr:Tm-1-like ATP-binding domain-containing protein [Bryobacteraceae bacterium]
MIPKTVALVGTFDTKWEEFAFLRDRIESSDLRTLLVNAGVFADPPILTAFSRLAVAEAANENLQTLIARQDRGHSVEVMAAGAALIIRRLFDEGAIHGIVSLGGSAGTTIATAAMRTLPVGFPKLMVSTLASGDTRPYVGTKDICMMYSVVDIAGLNAVSRAILSNAAAAICGMVTREQANPSREKPSIAATMFGVTTPCVTAARHRLEEKGYEVLVFHATGTGGQALEQLIEDGMFRGVLDITTTELADELVGGVLSAGPKRLEAAGVKGIPQIVCPGAIDMVNFGPMDSVPSRFRDRNLYAHNSTVTLMRTTPEECAQLGRVTAEKLNLARGPATVLIPLQGVSAIDKAGCQFYSPAALAAYRGALKESLSPAVNLVEIDAHINDERFAFAAADLLLESFAIASVAAD